MKTDIGPLNAAFIGGMAIGLAIAVFLFLISPPFTTANYCVAGEAPIACFREWSLMFAAWATVIGGVVAAYLVFRTIVKMNDQIENANRHQHENIEIQIGTKLALAQRVAGQCARFVSDANRFVDGVKKDEWPYYVVRNSLAEIRDFMENELIRSFVTEISGTDPWITDRILSSQRRAVTLMEMSVHDMKDYFAYDANVEDQRHFALVAIIKPLIADARSLAEHANEYDERWRPRIGE